MFISIKIHVIHLARSDNTLSSIPPTPPKPFNLIFHRQTIKPLFANLLHAHRIGGHDMVGLGLGIGIGVGFGLVFDWVMVVVFGLRD
ncbi:hypothetical protein [Moraxella bovoculi]|uniref:hypothetical protein n=1 Tax=Moraxella bovoculi TaxID=386891 RepID=UPI000624C204|nr:hypothetical protein [Moraxella bovoculi]AKG11728.1 hypothetical protein AAX07_06725 [Moraxella bovoculi]